MILVEREPKLPSVVESVKAQVLLALRANHALQEFDSTGDLAAWLDRLLEELVAAGAPRALTRVLLFYRSPAALAEVKRRMLPGGSLQAYPAPGCWPAFGKQLPELKAWAERLEPGWCSTPRGI